MHSLCHGSAAHNLDPNPVHPNEKGDPRQPRPLDGTLTQRVSHGIGSHYTLTSLAAMKLLLLKA